VVIKKAGNIESVYKEKVKHPETGHALEPYGLGALNM
jgi:hypothetical protein